MFFGLKSRGYRVFSIARPGMERSELHHSMNPQNIISEVVTACVELMDKILYQEGDPRGYHVVGHSFGASIALLMALRSRVSPSFPDFLLPLGRVARISSA